MIQRNRASTEKQIIILKEEMWDRQEVENILAINIVDEEGKYLITRNQTKHINPINGLINNIGITYKIDSQNPGAREVSELLELLEIDRCKIEFESEKKKFLALYSEITNEIYNKRDFVNIHIAYVRLGERAMEKMRDNLKLLGEDLRSYKVDKKIIHKIEWSQLIEEYNVISLLPLVTRGKVKMEEKKQLITGYNNQEG